MIKKPKDFKQINGMSDDLDFLIWTAELNKELQSFWKSMVK